MNIDVVGGIPPRQEEDTDLPDQEEDKKLDEDLTNIASESFELEDKSRGILVKASSKLFDLKQVSDIAVEVYDYILDKRPKKENGSII